MSQKTLSLFESHVSVGILPNHQALNKALLKDIQHFSKEDKMGKDWSKVNYIGGFTSYGSLSDMQERCPSFSTLQEKLQPFVEKFSKQLSWQIKKQTLSMNSCWFNIMPKNTQHASHLHPHSVISGAYYVSAPKGSVGIKLEDPRMIYFMNSPVRDLVHEISPKEGMFVLFESWMRHEVPVNRSQKPRVSISFNYSLN
jgi:uncharacterized protein (TIGR02466 family)